jgi:hypothetical protein
VISSAKIENTLAFLPNFWKSFSKLWQKPDFYSLFGIFPTESRIKTIFINKIPPKVDEFTILCSVSAGKPFETLSAEFSSPPTFQNNREPCNSHIITKRRNGKN